MNTAASPNDIILIHVIIKYVSELDGTHLETYSDVFDIYIIEVNKALRSISEMYNEKISKKIKYNNIKQDEITKKYESDASVHIAVCELIREIKSCVLNKNLKELRINLNKISKFKYGSAIIVGITKHMR